MPPLACAYASQAHPSKTDHHQNGPTFALGRLHLEISMTKPTTSPARIEHIAPGELAPYERNARKGAVRANCLSGLTLAPSLVR